MGLTVCGAQGLAISVTPSQKIDPEFNHFSHIQGSHSGPSIHTQAITINTSVLPVSFLPLLLFFFSCQSEGAYFGLHAITSRLRFKPSIIYEINGLFFFFGRTVGLVRS